jgi:hypothetical protein
MTRSTTSWVAGAMVVVALAHGEMVRAQGRANPQAAALKDFGDRVHAYTQLHDRVAHSVAPIGGAPAAEAVARHRDALAAALREARRSAREGDLFTPEVAGQVRTLVRRDLRSRDFRDALAAVEEVAYQSVWVNMPWPAQAPRPTIPARLLTSLYPLPQDLEYRLLDRHLVLVDVDAEMVVDLVRNVLPSSIRPGAKP